MSAEAVIGGIQIHTTSFRGASPEELAERALNRLMYVSETADPMVKAQAMVYREKIREVLIFYMQEAIKSDRTTLMAQLRLQGRADMADLIKQLN